MKTNVSSVNHITPGQLAEALRSVLPFGTPMIWGAPGIGKSYVINEELIKFFDDIVAAIAKNRGIKIEAGEPQVWEVRAGHHDQLDFGGLPYVEGGVQRRASPDIWPGVGATEKKYGILFLDEFPQAGRETQTTIQRLFDTGRIGDYVLPGHPKSDPKCKLGLVLIVLAGNRQSDRANSHGMGTQTGNRLVHFTLDADVPDWLAWAADNAVNPLVQAFIKQQPDYLFKLDPRQTGEHPTGPTPRSWVQVSHALDACPPPDLEMKIIAGLVGEEAARAFIALCHAARAIDVEEALRSPHDAEIPQDVGHQFAAAALLIRRANVDNFANVCRYVERTGDGEFYSPEIGVFVVEAIKRRTPLVAETATYRDFCLRWADIRS